MYLSPIFGLFLLGLFATVCVHFIKVFRKDETIDSFLPWLSIGMYSIFSGLLTSAGRTGFGVKQALESRYVTFSTYLSVSLIYLFMVMAERNKKIFKFSSWNLSKKKYLIITGIVVFILYFPAVLVGIRR